MSEMVAEYVVLRRFYLVVDWKYSGEVGGVSVDNITNITKLDSEGKILLVKGLRGFC